MRKILSSIKSICQRILLVGKVRSLSVSIILISMVLLGTLKDINNKLLILISVSRETSANLILSMFYLIKLYKNSYKFKKNYKIMLIAL